MKPQDKASCLYECRVMHHRFSPKVHRFDYRIFMFGIDLDELDGLDRSVGLFGVNRRALYSFREGDYLPTAETLHNGRGSATPGAGPRLKDRVIAYVGQHGVDLAGGRVLLVTLPRVAGYLFNPVSFYFCYGSDGLPKAAIAEVTNTFKEMKPYFIPAQQESANEFHDRVAKEFYVSPFTDVDVSFDFNLKAPGDRLSVQIDDLDGPRRTLTSTLTGQRLPLTGGRLALFTLKYPLITLKVIGLIHLHALRLWLKRVPWFAKAAKAETQKDLYRPHASIARSPSA
jgi:DUF1365 family protein